MDIYTRIEAFIKWGHALSAMLEELEMNRGESGNELSRIIRKAYRENGWFTEENSQQALWAIANMLEEGALESWLKQYPKLFEGEKTPKTVGMVMAGNIPAVGFHDVLCVLASGHKVQIRVSSDDKYLIPFLLEVLIKIEPRFESAIAFTSRLENMDAVIATGSNNSARYFDYYFGKYPHIIRKNRNSIAVLNGKETQEELTGLGRDIFSYFGLGCRSISKIYLPAGFPVQTFFEAMEQFSGLMQHNKYMNNFDYHQALFLLNSETFLTNNFLIFRQHEAIATPVAVLHYEYYPDKDWLEEHLAKHAAEIQCRVGVGGIPFGSAQKPGLADYADNIDTMAFLIMC